MGIMSYLINYYANCDAGRFVFVCCFDFFTRGEFDAFVREFDVFVHEFNLFVRV